MKDILLIICMVLLLVGVLGRRFVVMGNGFVARHCLWSL